MHQLKSQQSFTQKRPISSYSNCITKIHQFCKKKKQENSTSEKSIPMHLSLYNNIEQITNPKKSIYKKVIIS